MPQGRARGKHRDGVVIATAKPLMDSELGPTLPDDVVARALEITHAPRFAIVVRYDGIVRSSILGLGRPVIVGRGPSVDLCLREEKRLSRRHARFTLLQDRVLVEDLGSTNGTWIGEERILRGELDVGDAVRLGSLLACIRVLGPAGEDLGVDGEARFFRQLDEESVRARHFGRPCAVLAIRSAADCRCPPDSPREHVARWVPAIRSKLRPVDRLTLHGPDRVYVLLPEAGAELAQELARAVARLPAPKAPLLVGVSVWSEAASASGDLVEAAVRAASLATPEHAVEVAEKQAPNEIGSPPGEGPVFASARMLELLATARRVGASRVPVILHGETGTGKEVLARVLHESGPRRARPMVRVNCGAIPASLVESTLFGHEKGAFTGAGQQKKGVFEEADGGTVFLDEIGELPLAAQAALLCVLETGSFSRVGSSHEVAVDVRIVAATHCDLEAMAAIGSFRADLYYRLGTVTLEIPPLRERADEIGSLSWRFLRAANRANGRAIQRIEPEALALLLAYPWPGNVRELRNAIDRAVVVASGEAIGARDLPARVRVTGEPREGPRPPPARAPDARSDADLGDSGAGDLRDQMRQLQAQVIDDALREAGGSRAEAAKRLNMPLRTLAYKIKTLGIGKRGGQAP